MTERPDIEQSDQLPEEAPSEQVIDDVAGEQAEREDRPGTGADSPPEPPVTGQAEPSGIEPPSAS